METYYDDKVNVEHEGRELTVYVTLEEAIGSGNGRTYITDARSIHGIKIHDSDTGEEVCFGDVDVMETIRAKVASVLMRQQSQMETIDPSLAPPITGNALGVLNYGVTVFEGGEETHYDRDGRKTRKGKIRDIG